MHEIVRLHPVPAVVSDSDMTLGEGPAQVRLKGAKTKPCCDCNRYDTTVFRSVQGEAKAGMHRATPASRRRCAMLSNKNTQSLNVTRQRARFGRGNQPPRDFHRLQHRDGNKGTPTGSPGRRTASVAPRQERCRPDRVVRRHDFSRAATIAYPYHKMRASYKRSYDPTEPHGHRRRAVQMEMKRTCKRPTLSGLKMPELNYHPQPLSRIATTGSSAASQISYPCSDSSARGSRPG